MSLLEVRDLCVSVAGKQILNGLSLTINPGEVHAMMGPNGSGKSTLANVMAGRPGYQVTGGEIRYDGQDLMGLEPEARAHAGVFLAFQYPVEIPGVSNMEFLKAAVDTFQSSHAFGFEINPAHIRRARALCGDNVSIRTADFFAHDWPAFIDSLSEPILVIGNPPWVTSAELGKINGDNLPEKTNHAGERGIDAITGKSNFDLSESILNSLVSSLQGRDASIGMLCKLSVARKVLTRMWRLHCGDHSAAVYLFDAQRAFGAVVDACLLLIRFRRPAASGRGNLSCDVYESFTATRPCSQFGIRDGMLVSDVDLYQRHQALCGNGVGHQRWRS